ncbi:MAG: hypothetical protein K0S23_951 [Fluviicola sp.]|jgi:hypothetical protein|nr:hypothetical protein [Fluviicola sp.]
MLDFFCDLERGNVKLLWEDLEHALQLEKL